MKNIHLLPTDKPSKLFIHNAFNDLRFDVRQLKHDNNQNIYITFDEEIKEGDWCIGVAGTVIKVSKKAFNSIQTLTVRPNWKKIILTTDQDLIKDGVQAIDDEFLEWFVKNPSCEYVEVKSIKTIPALQLKGNNHCCYQIIIPQEEPKQETENLKNFKKLVSDEISPAMKDFIKEKQEILEEAYLNQLIDEGNKEFTLDRKLAKDVAIKYANWQAERMYSEENVFQFFEKYREDFSIHRNIQVLPSQFEQWFEQFKKK